MYYYHIKCSGKIEKSVKTKKKKLNKTLCKYLVNMFEELAWKSMLTFTAASVRVRYNIIVLFTGRDHERSRVRARESHRSHAPYNLCGYTHTHTNERFHISAVKSVRRNILCCRKTSESENLARDPFSSGIGTVKKSKKINPIKKSKTKKKNSVKRGGEN